MTEQQGKSEGGKEPPFAFNQPVFRTFSKFEKLPQRGEKAFSTRWLSAQSADLPRIIPRGMPGTRSLRARLGD